MRKTIIGIQLISSPPSGLQKAARPRQEVLITWSARTRQVFVIETSTDLTRWKEAPAAINELAPGRYQGKLTAASPDHQFFRVRLMPRDPLEPRYGRPYQLR